MARIVYGVSGEGSGHTSRSRVALRHLAERGHQLRVLTYDRGRQLADEFEVVEIEGLHIVSRDNRVSVALTLKENLARLPGLRASWRVGRELFERFAPELVISDFEPLSARLGRRAGLPVWTIDNQQRLLAMECPYPPGRAWDAFLARLVTRFFVPRPDRSLVVSFYQGRVTRPRVEIFPPLLRREVLETPRQPGDHVLVYLSFGYESFLACLRQIPEQRFVVYGYDRDEEEANLSFRPFSQQGFLEDLAGARAVMATAGFTLISEALHFRKPYLALPLRGQFEQELNAHLLEARGFGMAARRPEVEEARRFLARRPEFEAALSTYDEGGGQRLLERLDELLAGLEAGHDAA